MRLTLRTLLAYMDDILDPADHEELARKIEASPFATELIHRSRDAIRRLRLSAPDVLAGDSGDLHDGVSNLDANTAAEYLDSLLSPEEVAEFERSCLEAGPHADMLLAEAVSCHHILTLVLGEPAEVDGDLRQRMYALAEKTAAGQHLRVEPSHATPAGQAAEITPAPGASLRRTQIDADEAAVPDYILEAARTRRRKQRLMLSAAAAVVIGGAATLFLWPQDEVELPREMASGAMGNVDALTQGVDIGDESAESAADKGPPTAADSATTGAAATPGAEEAPAWDSAAADAVAPPFAAAPAPVTPGLGATTEATPPSAEPPSSGSAPIDNAVAAASPSSVEPAEPAPLVADAAAPAGTPSDAAAAESSAGPPPVPAPSDEATANVTSTPPAPPQAPPQAEMPAAEAPATELTASPAATPAENTTAAQPTEAAAEEGPKQLAWYLGNNNDLLLRFDAKGKSWIRLGPRSALAAGDRLLALPTFRTHVVLADANAYLGGGTEIDLAAPDVNAGDGEPTAEINLVMPYGRLIINSGLNGNRIRLTMGDETRTLMLASSSSLAVDVQRTFQRGADPEREPAPLAVQWYLTSGTATPVDALEGAKIEGPAVWSTAAGEDQPPQAIDKLPEWIDSEVVSDSQRRARERVSEALAPGSPVNLRLAELSDPNNLGRRIEDRSLAAEASAYVGEFDPLVKTLSDVNQKAAWKDRIEALRGHRP